ncbi:nuclear transport factor 2 family protein [Kribbella sp. NPDC020789]
MEDEIRAVAAAFDTALVGNDAAVIAGYFTDDWVYFGPDGKATKSDLIEWIATGRLAHHTMIPAGDERIAQVGNTVVLTARKTSSGTWEGTPYTADEWITDIYVQRDGRWRCAFSQKTDATRA